MNITRYTLAEWQAEARRRFGEDSAKWAFQCPKWQGEFAEITDKLDGLVGELGADYQRPRDIPIQKDFALQAVKTRCSAALFAMRAGKAKSIRSFLSKVQPDSLIKTLGIKEIVPEDQP